MKLLYDYFPIICFFIAYKLYGIYVATAVTIGASILQVAFFWLKNRRFETIHLITLAFVVVLGGATLIFHKAIFIKWKPSIIYWIFSIVLIGSHFFTTKPLLHRLLSSKISLPLKIWARLNITWAIFFLLLGFLNLYVVYNYSTSSWVNFKLFGTLGLTLVFIIAQTLYMARHMDSDDKTNKKKEEK